MVNIVSQRSEGSYLYLTAVSAAIRNSLNNKSFENITQIYALLKRVEKNQCKVGHCKLFSKFSAVCNQPCYISTRVLHSSPMFCAAAYKFLHMHEEEMHVF